MRGLEIIVFAVIALSALIGYYRGFLRVMYSLVSWVIVLALVVFAAPHLADFLENETKLKTNIQAKCVDYLEDNAGSLISENISDEITDSAASVIGTLLVGSGLYEEAAGEIAHFIVEGIAFFIVMTIAGIFTFSVFHMLDFASRIPVIKGPNKVLGAVAGGLKGLAFIWLSFYIISLCAASGFGGDAYRFIKESPFLNPLYENNPVFLILRH